VAISVVVAATAIVFVSALTGEFVSWDDDVNFTHNPHFQGLGWTQVPWAFTTFHLGVYQPLAWLALAAQFAIGGLSPVIYHVTSWLLHVLNAALVYLLLVALLERASPDGPRATWPAVAGALLWSLHPLRVEAAAWASCQPYLLATSFALLATLAHLHVAGGGGARWWLARLGLYVAAVLSKAEAIPLPLVWLVLDVYPLRRLGTAVGWWSAGARRVWLEKLPLVAVAAGAAIVAVAARAQGHHLTNLEMAGVGARLAHAALAVWFYLGKTLAPWTLSPYYPRPELLARGLAHPATAGAALAALGVTALIVWQARRVPALCAAWIVYLLFLLPHAGLVRIGNQLGSDRYTYLSSLGFAAAIAAGVQGLARGENAPARRRWLTRSVSAVAVVLAVFSVRQIDVWSSSESLWSFAYERSGAVNGHVANNWGAVLIGRRRYAEAVEVLSRAVELSPRNDKAFHNLGVALTATGADRAAATAFAEETRIRSTRAR
jgi:hypothetical protein